MTIAPLVLEHPGCYWRGAGIEGGVNAGGTAVSKAMAPVALFMAPWHVFEAFKAVGAVGRYYKKAIFYKYFKQWGHVAEWLRNGLQNRVHQFNSGRGLHHSDQ
jgi:hypothetical protein